MIGCACFSDECRERVERARAAVPIELSLSRVLDKLPSGECRATFVSYLRGRMYVDGVRVAHGEVQIVSTKSELIAEGSL